MRLGFGSHLIGRLERLQQQEQGLLRQRERLLALESNLAARGRSLSFGQAYQLREIQQRLPDVQAQVGGLQSRARFARGANYAAAAAAAAAAAVAAVSRASQRSAAEGLAGLSMGGTPAQNQMLRGFGGAVGMNMGQMAQLGEQLGGFNRAERLLRHIEVIRSLSREEDVLRYTRARGLESLQGVRFLTERQIAQMRQMAQENQGIFGQQRLGRAVQFNYEMARAQREMDDFLAGTGTAFIAGFADWIGKLNRWASGNTPGGAGMRGPNSTFGTGGTGGYAEFAARGPQGGGARTQGAMPFELRGQTLNEAFARQSISLGALVP